MANEEYVYNPISRETYEAIAYNAIGRASEVNNLPVYGLSHSTGNSGWSVGFMQWDFGQAGRGERADDMLARYQLWAPDGHRFNDAEIVSLSTRLTTRGQVGNELAADEKTRLNGFLRSDEGRAFVGELDRQQIERKWDNVGQPLSQIEWLQNLATTDPKQAAEIIAITSKLYNQNEVRGGRLIQHLEDNNLTSAQTSDWIGEQGVNGLNVNARNAIVSGRDKALTGTALMNSLETGDGQISQLWRTEVHENGNTGLTQNFNTSASVQLLDKLMRDPLNGERVRAQLENGAPRSPVVMTGGATETARVELSLDGVLTVRSPGGIESTLTPNGWIRNETQAVNQLGREQPPHDRPGAPVLPQRAAQEPRNDNHRVEQELRHQPVAPRNAQNRHENPDEEVPRHQRPVQQEQHNGQRNVEQPLGPPRAELDPRDRNHPDHALYSQALAGVHQYDAKIGRTPDDMSERMAASLTALAKENGLSRIDHVVFSIDNGRCVKAGENAFVVQGELGDPAADRAHMKTDVAVNTPAHDSFQKLDSVGQQQMQEAQQQVQQQTIRNAVQSMG